MLFLLCRLLHCSLRCVTYGKQWISQYTVCLQNMFWLTFQWSRLSLWLLAKIVAVHFGCLPVWIYGGVSLSKDWWLVWVAVAYCWVFCPMISALQFAQLLILCPRNLSFRKSEKRVERESGQDSAKWFLWELYSSSVLCIIHALECITSSRVVYSGPPRGAPGHHHQDKLTL